VRARGDPAPGATRGSDRRGGRPAGAAAAWGGGGAGAGSLHAQGTPPPAKDSGQQAGQPPTGRTVDTATARRLGLPTGPTRSFPKSDPVIDSLLKLQTYRITRYVAETLLVLGDSQTIFLRRQAFVERDGTQLEADSIRYHEASCRLDAEGDPRLFDRGTVLVGEGMRYDTCIRRGTVRDALTDFQQGGATWYMRGRSLAVDSGSTRVYGAGATFTSDPQPVPDYHFAAGQVKWINKSTMVARPVVLYVRDVPIMWLPFMFNDIRSGRHSGILVPRFGLNDLVRTTRSYRRHVTDFGYYFVINDYVDLLVSADWYAGRSVSFSAETKYRWLDRFVQGGLFFTRTAELDLGSHASRISWFHNQTFDSRTRFDAHIDYATSASVVSRTSLDPRVATATLSSSASFDKRFSWGALNVGGTRTQELSNDRVSQTFPDIRLAPAVVNITPSISWSPGFAVTTTQTFHNSGGALLVPGTTIPVDTLPLFFDDRSTSISIQTPIRFGRWTWGNFVTVRDVTSNQRQQFDIPDPTVLGGVRHVTYNQTFGTEVDWQTSINLPPLFTGTWKLQPGISIVNTTSGPFMLKNQFSGGEFARQGKRLAFNASMSPTFFGFFPGLGPITRIRHKISPLISYQYAPGDSVPAAYARAFDPTGIRLNAHTDPQQTISLGLSQTIEAKFKAPPGDTTSRPRQIRLLAITTGAVSYNFEQAKQPKRVGWQTASIDNTITSDLLPFSLRVTHDLWDGTVGLDTTRFAPFLTSISTSFTVTPATLHGLAALVGLGGGRPAPPPPPTDTTAAGAGGSGPSLSGNFPGQSGAASGVAGRAFALQMSYSSQRNRHDTTAALRHAPGRQFVTLNLSFAPTAHWSANWNTSYDFGTAQFADHSVSLERDLRRWHASFRFYKSANGNFSFSFNIALIDQSDIKFDYDQQTFVR